jgi:hypothetical protein
MPRARVSESAEFRGLARSAFGHHENHLHLEGAHQVKHDQGRHQRQFGMELSVASWSVLLSQILAASSARGQQHCKGGQRQDEDKRGPISLISAMTTSWRNGLFAQDVLKVLVSKPYHWPDIHTATSDPIYDLGATITGRMVRVRWTKCCGPAAGQSTPISISKVTTKNANFRVTPATESWDHLHDVVFSSLGFCRMVCLRSSPEAPAQPSDSRKRCRDDDRSC